MVTTVDLSQRFLLRVSFLKKTASMIQSTTGSRTFLKLAVIEIRQPMTFLYHERRNVFLIKKEDQGSH